MKINRITSAAIAAVLLIGLSACGDKTEPESAKSSSEPTADPTVFDVNGTLTLSGSANDDLLTYGGSGCTGYGGYDDIGSGTQVVIYDNAGTMLATGGLYQGERVDKFSCEFDFTVRDVPIQETDLYAVEVSHRGQITFTQSNADAVGLSLG